MSGPYHGIKLFCSYNTKYKQFPIGSKFYGDWCVANGALPCRKDKMSKRVFLKKAFLVKVRDVAPKYPDGQPKPNMFHYSVVDRIIEKVAE